MPGLDHPNNEEWTSLLKKARANQVLQKFHIVPVYGPPCHWILTISSNLILENRPHCPGPWPTHHFRSIPPALLEGQKTKNIKISNDSKQTKPNLLHIFCDPTASTFYFPSTCRLINLKQTLGACHSWSLTWSYSWALGLGIAPEGKHLKSQQRFWMLQEPHHPSNVSHRENSHVLVSSCTMLSCSSFRASLKNKFITGLRLGEQRLG